MLNFIDFYEKKEMEETMQHVHFSFVARKVILSFFLIFTSIFLLIYKEDILYIFGVIPITFIWLFLIFLFDSIIKKQKTKKKIENANFIFILLELIVLTSSIYYGGGISTMGVGFYVLTLIYAHNYLSSRRAFLANLFAIVLVLGMVSFEFFNILPHRQNFYFDLFGNNKYVFVTTLTYCAFLAFFGWTINLFINMLRSRNAEIKNAYKENQDIKDSLSIRVEARNKELKELAKKLKMDIEKRNKELQQRIVELEKANKKVVDRELRMIEIKKRLRGETLENS